MAKIPQAKRMKDVKYAIRDIIAEAKQLIPEGTEILPLNIGDPLKFDFETPEHVSRGLVENLDKSSNYAASEGIDEAREAVAGFQDQFGVKGVGPDDVLVTSGGAEGIELTLGVLLNPGDNVLLPSPGYPAYEAQVNFLGAEYRYYELDEENQWQIDVNGLEELIDDKTRAIVIINPNNPTGALFSKETLTEVLKVAEEHGLVVIADEQVYPFYVYEGDMHMCSSLGVDVPVLTIGSMSKTYLVPGWRMGWVVVNDPTGVLSELKEAMLKLKRIKLCSSHPAQWAVKPALGGSHDFLDEVKQKLIKRRDLVVDGVGEIDGLSVVEPKGAFYSFVRIDLPIESDKQYVLDLAKETGILCVPGEGFGQKSGTHHFRIVFLPEDETINNAMNKLAEHVKCYKA